MVMEFTPEQEEAIEWCCTDEPIVGVTGQAGTGKTAIIKEIYRILREQGLRVAVCALAGKAVDRIKEATGIEDAVTIHRLLEFPQPGEIDPDTGEPVKWASYGPKRNADNPLEYDAVLCDEYSMVNWELNNQLLDALPHGVLRAFGDMNQLKPVEKDEDLRDEPSPFSSILKECPSVKLKRIWRNGGVIVENADRILKRQIPQDGGDFFQMIVKPEEVLTTLDAWVMDSFEHGIDFLFKTENQIITPSNKTSIGVAELNRYFLEKEKEKHKTGWYFPPRHKWDKKPWVHLREGLKVIQTKNDYNLKVFNGQTGIITRIDPEFNVTVDFGDRQVLYPPIVTIPDKHGFDMKDYPQANLDLAFVVSTHKSQGSEYQHIIYVMGCEARFTHSIGNFYTGVTRARKTCTVITDEIALVNSITNR